MSTVLDNRFYREKAPTPPVRVRKSNYSTDWHVEQEFMCINGLRAWFVIATVHEADESEIGYTEGEIGSAEQRARRVASALSSNHPQTAKE